MPPCVCEPSAGCAETRPHAQRLGGRAVACRDMFARPPTGTPRQKSTRRQVDDPCIMEHGWQFSQSRWAEGSSEKCLVVVVMMVVACQCCCSCHVRCASSIEQLAPSHSCTLGLVCAWIAEFTLGSLCLLQSDMISPGMLAGQPCMRAPWLLGFVANPTLA